MKKIDSEINWLKKRFTEHKRFAVQDGDLKALNSIIEYYNESKKPIASPNEDAIRKLIIHTIANKIKADTHNGNDENFGIRLTNRYIKEIASRIGFILRMSRESSINELTNAINNMRLSNHIKMQGMKTLYDENYNITGVEIRKFDVDMDVFERIIRTEWKPDEVEPLIDELVDNLIKHNL